MNLVLVLITMFFQGSSFSGTWTATTGTGTVLTLQLAQDPRAHVTGSLSGNGTEFSVDAQVRSGRMTGLARNQAGAVHLAGQIAGGTLSLTISDVTQDGQPVAERSQQITMTRAGSAGATSSGLQQLMPGVPGGRAAQASASSDPYVGSFHGGDLTITLQRSGQGYTGTAVSSTAQYQLQAQIVNGVMNGAYNDNGMQRTFQAQVQGDNMQLVAEGSTFMLQRTSSAQAARPAQAATPAGSSQLATTPQDQQIARLFMSSRWCYMSYSQTSGTSHTERVQFFQNGTVVQSTGGETYNSGANGTVSSQSSGGNQGFWKIQNGMLMLSQDNMQWAPVQLQITQNSNGYPIVNAGGKEYSQCN